MKIGFEAKRIFTNNTGLGNYGRFIVNALSVHIPDNNYYLFTPKHILQAEAEALLRRENVKLVTPSSFFNLTHTTSLWRTWGLSKESITQDLDVFHGLSQELPIRLPGKIKKVVTVHDLIFYRYPRFYNPIDVAIYKKKLKSTCAIADKIIAISGQTRDDLINFLNADESKIEIIHQGCHPNFKKLHAKEDIEELKIKYKLPREYILNVGTIEERKNVLVLIKALALISRESRLPLVIMGKQTAYYKVVVAKARELGVMDQVVFLSGIPFADFPKIYQGASLFVYPSLFEGFGIPLIEAIESNVPVITSTGSCFREAAGPDSIFVDPGEEQELASKITLVLGNQELKRKMVTASKSYATQFSPPVIAAKLNTLYKQ